MRTRGNKQGSVYYRKDRKRWVAQIVIGWRPPNKENGKPIPIKKTIGGFKTKKEALSKLDKLLNGDIASENKTLFNDVFEEWYKQYEPRVAEKTMKGYRQSYNHFANVHYRRMSTITASELQSCMDACPKGKRTHQLMKVVAGLLWSYALDMNYVSKDITNNLYIGKHEVKTREPLSPLEIKQVYDSIGKLRYAEYIYCMCYLGFRPGEFFEIKKEQVITQTINNETVYYIMEGKKTAAGKNRIVIIPKQILPFVIERLFIPGSDYLFPFYYFKRNKDELIEFRQMKINYFEESVFKPIMDELNISGKVPYSTRHSYADKLKHAEGDIKDKAQLIGHSDYNFTRVQYQSSPLEDLKTVTDSLS